jgi:hypothetical protein
VSGWQHVGQSVCSPRSSSCAWVCVWFLQPPTREACRRVSSPHLSEPMGTSAVLLMPCSRLDGRRATGSLSFGSCLACSLWTVCISFVGLLGLCHHCGVVRVGWTSWLTVCRIRLESPMCLYIVGFQQNPANWVAADYVHYFLRKSDGLETPSSSR